jgi:transcriptional regulator with XRE-family HTH domain
MMGELGERLRAAREEKGLSVDQVAEATKIPLTYLEALEGETLDAFTSDVHARGFLRNYAGYLGLDPEETADLYDQLPRSDLRHHPQARQETSLASPPRSGRGGLSMLAADALLALVVVALLGLVGFSVYQRQNPQEVAPTPAPASTPTVTPMPVFEGTSYTMDVHLNYPERRLDVRERIDYTNVTSETLPNLMLNVHANRNRKTFELNDIKVDMDGELVQPEVFPLDVTLRVELPRELQPNEHIALHMDYTLNLPQISPGEEFTEGSFGYSKRAASLGNWYPVLAPYREDKGWYALTYFPVGDPYVTEVADYDVTITTTEGVIIAGTGQETRTGNRWHYEAEQARSFAFAASDRYQVATAQAGDIAVHSYYFPDSQEAGEVALETAVQALDLFGELYGPYPYSDYRVAETEFAGGMEFSGLTFLGSLFYDEYDGTTHSQLISLTAHEVSHQWFYGLVGNDQVTEPWLDEALAQYSAFLYYERILPDDTDWWWNYEVEQWAPTGKIDTLIYEYRNNRDYFDAVYRRGAQFVQDLRETMGDPAFFAFLEEYQRRYSHSLVKSRDFFALVQEFTTADLVELQEEYFRQRIIPYP